MFKKGKMNGYPVSFPLLFVVRTGVRAGPNQGETQSMKTLAKPVTDVVARTYRFNRPLALVALAHALIIPLVIVAALVDPRTINGANGWIKPLKFAVSIAVYNFTFAWLLTYVQGRRRWVQLAAAVTAAALLAEYVIIVFQVVRGVGSHFNVATPLDEALYSTMGLLIVGVSAMALLAAIWLFRQPMTERVFAVGLRWGVLLSFAGMIVAFLMTQPTSDQRAAAQATGGGLSISGAHSVGVPDGGAGLPLLGWSTEGGDLRVPHFFGLHAMQALPLASWLLMRPTARRRWSERQRIRLARLAGFGYAGLMGLLTWQALRGQSIVHPDSLTLGAFGLLVAVVGLAALWIARPQPTPAVAPQPAR